MDNRELFEEVKSFIIKEYGGKPASGGKEVVKRCHICGDSRDPHKAHMYIGINRQNGLIVYNCFKCGAKGLVNNKFFRDLGSSVDVVMSNSCDQYNRSILKSMPYNMGNMQDGRFVIYNNHPNLWISNSYQSTMKLRYINSRLGLNLTLQDCANMKIILNLKDYLVANHIKFITRNQKSIDEIDRGFIGFLSVDNGFINMRRIVEEGVLSQYTDHRHLVYNIYNSVDNNHRFYIIGKNVDTSRRIKLYICEGAFDVLGLYYNILQYRYEDNVVIGSAGGKEYLTLIRFFLCEMGLIDVEIHLCPDSDIEQYKMDRIKEFLRPLYIPVYVHRNVAPGEKDFGVSRDRINEGIMKMI